MDEKNDKPAGSNDKNAETAHARIGGVITMIASFAFFTFFLGAIFGAPWPAAVASCGLSAMGVGVAYVLLRRN